MTGHFTCVIQADSAAAAATDTLEAGLVALHAEHADGDDATVTWREVPAGWMFTEGEQSTSSIIACVVGRTTNLAERERYMRAVCTLWTETAGCTDHEVVVSLTDSDAG